MAAYRSAYLSLSRRDTDRIGNHKGRHLLLDRDNICKSDDNLDRADDQRRTKIKSFSHGAYVGDPPKDVGMERQVVFRNVNPALNQNILLQCTSVICGGAMNKGPSKDFRVTCSPSIK